MKIIQIIRSNILLLCFLVLVVLLSLTIPAFRHPQNIINILKQVSITGIIAMGVALLVISGCIDLSVGFVMANITVTVAILSKANVPILVTFLIVILLGAFMGTLNGYVVTRGRITPFIATLGMQGIYSGVAMILCNGVPISIINKDYTILGNGEFLKIPYPVIAFLFILAFFHFIVLNKTKLGRYAYAIGGNENAAKTAGINVENYRFLYYVIVGALAGLSGLFLAARIQTGAGNAGAGTEFDALIACIIGGVSFSGGVGKASGAFLGLLIIGVINNSLDLLGVLSYYQYITKGIIILVTMWMDSRRRIM